MASDLIPLIKQAAKNMIDNEQLCDLRYGRVISTSPLKVKVTDQFIIPTSLLIVPQHLTNYEVKVTVGWNTEEEGLHRHFYDYQTPDGDDTTDHTSDAGSHTHSISGTKTITIHNALQTGDKVALLRKQGGNSYFILDRV